MYYAILRTAKLKTMGNIGGSLAHNYRTIETPNADPNRTPKNHHTVATPEAVKKAIQDRLPEKRRSDAVLCIEYLITASPEWDGWGNDKEAEFFKRSSQWLSDKHGAENIVFVDGWTGKGAICRELTQNLADYPALFDPGWDIPRLVTLADLGGYSWLSASCEDWLIPFGILGSVISGLISRTILKDTIDFDLAKKNCYDPNNWHSCLVYQHLAQHDISVDFTDKILNIIQQNPHTDLANWNNHIRLKQQKICLDTIDWISDTYAIKNINHIKPSIAEATRAVLRRVPEKILIRDPSNPHVQLLLHFAQERNIAVDILGAKLGSYHAVTLIKKVEKNK